jgi:hypothetical protein
MGRERGAPHPTVALTVYGIEEVLLIKSLCNNQELLYKSFLLQKYFLNLQFPVFFFPLIFVRNHVLGVSDALPPCLIGGIIILTGILYLQM